MIDIRLLRTGQNGSAGVPELIRESQRRRFASVELVDEVIALDEAWRRGNFEVEKLRQDLNCSNKTVGKEIQQMKLTQERLKAQREGIASKKAQLQSKINEEEHYKAVEFKKKFDLFDAKLQLREEAEADMLNSLTNSLVETKKRLAVKESEVQEVKRMLDAKIRAIGNILHESVPVSEDEANNVTIKTWGERRCEENLYNHVDLCIKLGIADFEKGTAVAGGRGFFLLEDGVFLDLALINYGLAFLRKRGYQAMYTPFFMRNEAMEKCAQLAQYDDELYKLSGDGDEKYLIATSEQPLCAYHLGGRYQKEQLPIRYAGYSTCFRKEAGSHGRDTAGIFRVHQFEKIEQFCVTGPDGNDSWEMFEEMINNSQDFYKELGLPYRVVSVVSGALNDAAAKKYDLEAWFPASKNYRELVSCTNCTDYQARRLGISYGQNNGNGGSKKFVHLLNCTLTATQRTICCILETYQKHDGVEVPKVLQPYMGGIEFLPFKKHLNGNRLKKPH